MQTRGVARRGRGGGEGGGGGGAGRGGGRGGRGGGAERGARRGDICPQEQSEGGNLNIILWNITRKMNKR